MIGLYLSFILAIHSKGVPELCALVGAVLQYFFLVTFMIMGAEAINLYLKLVVVLGGKIQHYVLKATLTCWSKMKYIMRTLKNNFSIFI